MPKSIHIDLKGVLTSTSGLTRSTSSLKLAQNAVIEGPGVVRKAPALRSTAENGEAETYVYNADGYVHTVRQGSPSISAVSLTGGTTTTDMVKAETVAIYEKVKGSEFGTSSLGDPALTTIDPDSLQDTIELYRKMDVEFPTGRQQSVMVDDSIFVTTGNQGLHRFDLEGTQWVRRPAGVPKALPPFFERWNGDDTQVNVSSAGSENWLADDYAVAYRLVWFFEFPDGRRIYGPPSSRMVFWNTSGSIAGVAMWIPVPFATNTTGTILTDDSAAYGVEIYRSISADLGSGTWPNDVLYQVGEQYIDGATLVADAMGTNVITYFDKTPEDSQFLGKELYTNNTEGQNAKHPPENFLALAEWRNRLWGAVYKERHYMELSMIGLPINDDLLAINDEYYFFKTSNSGVDPNWAKIESSYGIEANLFFTAQSLCSAINEHSSVVYAYLVAAPGATTLANGAGVTIILEHREVPSYSASKSFDVYFQSATADLLAPKFRPYDPNSTFNIIYSKSEIKKNVVWCSENGEPNAWPADERFSFVMGGSNVEILAMKPLEEGLYVFTTRGLFRISGRSISSFFAELVDETFVLIGDECITSADGALWAWGTQGFARIRNGRVEYVSGPIQDQLDKYTEAIHHKTAAIGDWTVKRSSYCFCSSDTMHGRIYLWLPDADQFDVPDPPPEEP